MSNQQNNQQSSSYHPKMPPTLYGPPPPNSPEPQGVLYGPVPDLYETSKKRKWHYLIIVISIIIGFVTKKLGKEAPIHLLSVTLLENWRFFLMRLWLFFVWGVQ